MKIADALAPLTFGKSRGAQFCSVRNVRNTNFLLDCQTQRRLVGIASDIV
ncbi:MAG: hypothetical protein HRU34_05195 [Richelia sp.]|nr:hypothetical protein [Richelia sp.]CDN11175.1 hypothetical protein RintRC_4755 [Richelia intracellularis]